MFWDNIFWFPSTATFRLVFDQTTGYHSLASLTHKMNHHSHRAQRRWVPLCCDGVCGSMQTWACTSRKPFPASFLYFTPTSTKDYYGITEQKGRNVLYKYMSGGKLWWVRRGGVIWGSGAWQPMGAAAHIMLQRPFPSFSCGQEGTKPIWYMQAFAKPRPFPFLKLNNMWKKQREAKAGLENCGMIEIATFNKWILLTQGHYEALWFW